MGHIARLWWAEARAIPQDVLRSRKSTDSSPADDAKNPDLKLTRL